MIDMENLLREAINKNSIEVFYQPKLDLTTGELCGAEALCRLFDPERGSISPAVFIPIAEQSELIFALENSVLQKVCEQIYSWQCSGLSKFPISVNVSGKHILQKDFRDTVNYIIASCMLDPSCLELEITETWMVKDFNEGLRNIVSLYAKGIIFSLDDFGTGYSSLLYLQQLPIKTVKIDISYIKNITINKTAAKLVEGIIALSRAIGVVSLAEGVETIEQLELLRALQCDQIQGYFYSKPLSASNFYTFANKDNMAYVEKKG